MYSIDYPFEIMEDRRGELMEDDAAFIDELSVQLSGEELQAVKRDTAIKLLKLNT